MPTGTIDSAIFKDIFGTEAMRQVWSDGNRIQKYLDFEAGLARAQARLGIIPQEACDEIVQHCGVDRFDVEKLKKCGKILRYSHLYEVLIGSAANLSAAEAFFASLSKEGPAFTAVFFDPESRSASARR